MQSNGVLNMVDQQVIVGQTIIQVSAGLVNIHFGNRNRSYKLCEAIGTLLEGTHACTP